MKRPDLLPRTIEGMLAHAQEEAAELSLALAKCARFGFKATDPETGIEYDNLADAIGEFKDVEHALARLKAALIFDQALGG